jgi:hypothetical protein
MDSTLDYISPATQAEIDRAARKLQSPGVVFGEPLREGTHTLIPVIKTVTRSGATVTRPVAVILVHGKKVRVKLLQRGPLERVLMVFGMTMLMGTCAVVLFPPWRPDTSLLAEVARLISTIRGA